MTNTGTRFSQKKTLLVRGLHGGRGGRTQVEACRRSTYTTSRGWGRTRCHRRGSTATRTRCLRVPCPTGMLASMLLAFGEAGLFVLRARCLLCAEKQAQVLARGQNPARVWPQVAAAPLLLPCILPPPSSRTHACFFCAHSAFALAQTAHTHTHNRVGCVCAALVIVLQITRVYLRHLIAQEAAKQVGTRGV